MASRFRIHFIFALLVFGGVSTTVVAEEPLRLAMPNQTPDISASDARDQHLAQRLMLEADAMALDAVAREMADAAPELAMRLRPSGLVFFRVVALSHSPDDTAHVATYIAQHSDETFECGEIAWREGGGPVQVERHDRRFFQPALLRDAGARRGLQRIGCL